MARFRKGLGILLAAALSIAPASAFYAEDTSNAAAIDKEAFETYKTTKKACSLPSI